MITHHAMRFSDLIGEGWLMMLDHWREIDLYQSTPLDVDHDLINKMDRAGHINAFAARDGRDLIGYAVYVVAHMPHHKSVLAADNDLFYLSPNYRKGRNAVSFLLYCMSMLKARGVTRVRHRVKVTKDWSKVLARSGFSESERIYEAEI